jgi:hypothetical protein
MTNPTLVDASAPEPEAALVDVSSFGEVTQIYCTSDFGYVIFARGRLKISPEQFFSLGKTLSRETKA